MSKYRVVKVPMIELIGWSSWKGYTHAFYVEKRVLFWWFRLNGTMAMDSTSCHAILEEIESGKRAGGKKIINKKDRDC